VNRLHPPLRIATALLLAVVVLGLGLLSTSPEAHAWAHGADCATAPDDHGHDAAGAPVGDPAHVCVVTLFAQGVAALLTFFLLLLARPSARGARLRPAGWLPVGRPRYWLVPSHAPPSA